MGRKIERTIRMSKRDGGRCYLCGYRILLPSSKKKNRFLLQFLVTADHLIPASDNGTRALTNLKSAHRFCNTLRGNKPFHELNFGFFKENMDEFLECLENGIAEIRKP